MSFPVPFLTLVRHAHASSNAEQSAGYIRREGDHYSLTDIGVQQAELTAYYLRESYDWSKRPTIFVSSPSLRAQQTCEIIRNILGFPDEIIRSDIRLRERRWGAWEGRLQSEVMTPEIITEIDSSRGTYAPPGGDSACDIADNISSWLPTLFTSSAVSHVVVSHGFTIRSILANIYSIHAGDIQKDTTGRVDSVVNAGYIGCERSREGSALWIIDDQRKAEFLPRDIWTRG